MDEPLQRASRRHARSAERACPTTSSATREGGEAEMFKQIPAVAAVIRGMPTAGVLAVPSSAALTGVAVPWYAWLAVSLGSLGLMGLRMYLAYRRDQEWLRVYGKNEANHHAIIRETVAKVDKLPADEASRLMSTITGLAPDPPPPESRHKRGESPPAPPDLPYGAP